MMGHILALSLPTDRRTSRQISAQSANIYIISGATFTSEAYAQSLHAALDSAQH